MDTILIAAVVGAVGAVLAAWINISRQTKRKTDLRLNFYRHLGERLFQVRKHGETIGWLLSNDPGPDFAKNIVTAANAFRDACDGLQDLVGNNRLLISKKTFDNAANLITASAGLIDSIRRGMSRTLPPDQMAYELTEKINIFKSQLLEIEELLGKESHRL
jgi:hypothetical protein